MIWISTGGDTPAALSLYSLLSSSFGQHFVFISERAPGNLPPLDAVRPAVLREWENARRLETEQKLYASLRSRYQIVIEEPRAKAAEAASR